MSELRVLALEPYYGGSHRAFLDGWSRPSRHDWTILSLPAYKWKWRMRHSAVTFAEDIAALAAQEHRWDVLFCSEMLNLAELKGLAPAAAALPAVTYFHENQLTYPVQHEDQRDLHFALINMTTALAATEVWFNSAFHRDSFLAALTEMLRRMADYQPYQAVEAIRRKSFIYPQGIAEFGPRGPRPPGAMRILWAARWEHDKGPEAFIEAMRILRGRGVDFRLSVLGQQFRECPPAFARAREEFADRIDHWGYQPARGEYESALLAADVIVSTAGHEFFGVSAAEAIAAGAYPVLPRRLAYPEILGLDADPTVEEFFYDGGPEELAERLAALSRRIQRGLLWAGDPDRARRIVKRFSWRGLAGILDDALQRAAATTATPA